MSNQQHQDLRLTQIRTNGGTQMRAALNRETVVEYADAMRRNETFPPVIVYYDGADYWLADGFHRVEAAHQAHGSARQIAAIVRPGTRRDAILHAAGANANHGQRRTNADKRRAVEALIRDEEWAAWSDREIARVCNVTHPFVAGIRKDLTGNDYQIPTDRTVQRNGQTYTMQTTNIAAANQHRPTPNPAESPAINGKGENADRSRYRKINQLSDQLKTNGWGILYAPKPEQSYVYKNGRSTDDYKFTFDKDNPDTLLWALQHADNKQFIDDAMADSQALPPPPVHPSHPSHNSHSSHPSHPPTTPTPPRQLTYTEIEAVIWRAIQHAGHTTPVDQLAWLAATTIADYRPLLNPGVTLDHDPDLFDQMIGYIRGKLQRQITAATPAQPTLTPISTPTAVELVWAALGNETFPRPILPAKIKFTKTAPFAVYKAFLAKGETVTDETLLSALGKVEAALTLQLDNCDHTHNGAPTFGPNNRCTLCGHPETAESPQSITPIPPIPPPDPIEAPPRPHVTNNSGNNEWYTPAPIVEAARKVLGAIDLDPASCVAANEVVKAERFYDIVLDGLTQPWTGRIWLNPPYASDLIGKFVEKLTYHLNSEDIAEAIILVNNATETAWFQDLAAYASAVCFPKGRIKYWNPDRPDALSPLQGQAILYIGPNNYKFRSIFSAFGVVL
jgi:hypothetical protein